MIIVIIMISIRLRLIIDYTDKINLSASLQNICLILLFIVSTVLLWSK